MMVYNIPADKAEQWRGIYNGVEFLPMIDAYGNYVLSVDTYCEHWPFMAELAALPQIEYVPATPPIGP